MSLKRNGLKESERRAEVNNFFSDLCTIIMQSKCNNLKNTINFYIIQNDMIAVEAALKSFGHELKEIFFFCDYQFLSEKEKEDLSNQAATAVEKFIFNIKRSFVKDDIADAVFECDMCLYKLKSYE